MNNIDYYWDEIFNAMNPEIRNKIADEHKGCSNEVFLYHYIKIDKNFENKFWEISAKWTKK